MDMERLTINLNPTTNRCTKVSTDLCYKYVNCFDCPQYKKMIDRLAAYENTGLEPEEITDLMAAHGTGIGQLAEYRAVGTVNHLRELVQAETEGRLVMLPCKVGDTVYAIAESICKWRDADKCSNYCSGHSYEGCWEGTLEIEECEFTVDMIGKFGKTIFLTREDAEATMGGGAE